MPLPSRISLRTWPVILATIIIPLVCLIPFLSKPFHMDDLTYLWPARQIHQHPSDFYGFTANWYGVEAPMSQMNKNPPLISYYIALAAVFLGWSEKALHFAFLIPALAVSLGTYVLARSLCSRPHLAALAAVLTPAFLVSSTNVMCDTLMLAFFIWAVALWVRGMERDNSPYLVLAVVCISLAALTKYFAISLIPLLLAYSLGRNRSWDRRFLLFLVPVIVLVAYEILTFRLYGTGLLIDAASYATSTGELRGVDFPTKLITGLSFTGGCLAVVAFYAPALWPRRWWGVGILIFLLCIVVVLAMGTVGKLSLRDTNGIQWFPTMELALFIAAGLHVLILAATDMKHNRDADALLLFLWILGTFVFTTFLNWSTNGRTVLPMVPAAGILVMRRVDHMSRESSGHAEWRAVFPLIPATCLALLVAWADFSLACCHRAAASTICRELKAYPHTVWFQGHWGFQYYMEACGAKAVDFSRPAIEENDVIIVPSHNTNVGELAQDTFHLAASWQCMPLQGISTLQKDLRAGFYSDIWGPLPFAFGIVKVEEYKIYLAGQFDHPADAVKRFLARIHKPAPQ